MELRRRKELSGFESILRLISPSRDGLLIVWMLALTELGDFAVKGKHPMAASEVSLPQLTCR